MPNAQPSASHLSSMIMARYLSELRTRLTEGGFLQR